MNQREDRAVVVTGASSGIGQATALCLAERGFRVFAGVRKTEDGESLRTKSAGRIVPLILDVTDAVSVAAAAESVRAQLGDHGLDGLVNNAGIATPAPVEYMTADVLRRQFEVNVFGQVAVIQSFLPLIRRAGGRIVNVGSVGSHLPFPSAALCAGRRGRSAF